MFLLCPEDDEEEEEGKKRGLGLVGGERLGG